MNNDGNFLRAQSISVTDIGRLLDYALTRLLVFVLVYKYFFAG